MSVKVVARSKWGLRVRLIFAPRSNKPRKKEGQFFPGLLISIPFKV